MAPLEGPVCVGALVDAVMLGCLFVQSFLYYKNSRASAWLLGVLISLILFLLIANVSCMAAWLLANANATEAPIAAILFGVSNVFGALILFFERCLFAHRVLKMSKNHLLSLLLFVFCIFSFTTVVGAASIFFTGSTVGLATQLGSSWIFTLVVISGLVCDSSISFTTAFCLRYETPTELADTMGHASRLFILVAETGSITIIFDVVFALTYWLTKSNLAWVGLFVCLPGVFANTSLVALNVRGQLRADVEHQCTSRIRVGETLIEKRGKRPPIIVKISEQVDKRTEKALSRGPSSSTSSC